MMKKKTKRKKKDPAEGEEEEIQGREGMLYWDFRSNN